MGIRRQLRKSHHDGPGRSDAFSRSSPTAWNSVGESYGGQSLLHAAYPEARALSALRWISASGRSAGWSRAPDGSNTDAESAIPRPDHHGLRLQLLAGISAARRASGGARRLGRSGRHRADSTDVSGDSLGCNPRSRFAAQTYLPDFQRLHNCPAQRAALRLFSAR